MPTSHQTIGPFWHGLAEKDWHDATRFGARGPTLHLEGQILDGEGAPVTDACVELWQTSPPAGDTFPAWARCATDEQGRFHLISLMPTSEPYVSLTIHARGLLKPLFTRAYFALNERDPALQRVPAERRATLLAIPRGDHHVLDIRLQGENETVFFEIGP